MNLIVLNDGGRIVKIAPDGTETDVTAELDRRVSEAKARVRSPAP
jgi:predicted RNA-binding protein associated with RNAse of E/G family